MAATGDRNDPFPAFRFKIKLDDFPVGGFSECIGLQLETEIHDYQEGGENRYVHKFPTRVKQSNITLKRGIVDRHLWDWYYQTVEGKIDVKAGSIFLYDPSGNDIVMEWEFKEAFPVKISGPELNAQQNNVAVETFELCYHTLIRKK